MAHDDEDKELFDDSGEYHSWDLLTNWRDFDDEGE